MSVLSRPNVCFVFTASSLWADPLLQLLALMDCCQDLGVGVLFDLGTEVQFNL